jgi:O-antigen/teichoic acid export membrane protein
MTPMLVFPILLAGAAADLWTEANLTALQATYSIARATAANSLIALAGTGAIVASVLNGQGLVTVASLIALSSLAGAVATAIIFYGRHPIRKALSLELLRTLAFSGLPILAYQIALLIYGSIDYVMLLWLDTTQIVGQYGLAYRLVSIPIIVPIVLSSVLYPALSVAAFSKDREPLHNAFMGGCRVVLIGTIPMSVGIQLLAPDIVQLLTGAGNDYIGSVVLIRILALHIPIVAIDSLVGTAIFAMHRNKKLAIIAWIAAFANPALNLALIPLTQIWWGNGAIGAATATVLVEALLCLAMLRLVADVLNLNQLCGVLGRVCAATAFMVPVVAAGNAIAGVPLAVVAGVATYAAGCVTLGLAHPRDIARTYRTFVDTH